MSEVVRSFGYLGCAIIVACTAMLAVPGICSAADQEQAVCGTDILLEIEATLDSIVTRTPEQGYALWVKHIADLWNRFVDQEERLFGQEIGKPDSLAADLERISNGVEKLRAISVADTTLVKDIASAVRSKTEDLASLISKPVLLVFYGPKCTSWPNCKAGQNTMMSVENAAIRYAGKVRIALIDAKKEKETAQRFKIMLVPTLVFFDHQGYEVHRRSGEISDLLIKDQLNELLR